MAERPAAHGTPTARPSPELLAFGALLAGALALRALLLDGPPYDWDEGVYWASLRSLSAGHTLYGEVYSSQPPAFLEGLRASFALGGSLPATRLGVVAASLAGVAAALVAARALAGPLMGVAAGALLAVDPLALRQSVTVQSDGPAVALGVVAVALTARAHGRSGRGATAASGLGGAALALAALVKPLGLVAAAPVAVLLLDGPDRRRRALAFLGGGLAATAAALLPLAGSWPAMTAQSVGLHLGARATGDGGISRDLLVTVARELPLLALATAGVVLEGHRHPRLVKTAGAWLGAGLLVLAVQRPLWPHHLVVVVPPLCLVASLCAARLRSPRPLAAAAAVIAAAAVVSVGAVRLAAPDPASSDADAAALAALTAPDDVVVTDDQAAAAAAGRQLPPSLVDTSFVRVHSGDLAAGDAEAATSAAGARAVLFATGRLDALPGFRSWVEGRFPLRVDLGGGRLLYLRPRP